MEKYCQSPIYHGPIFKAWLTTPSGPGAPLDFSLLILLSTSFPLPPHTESNSSILTTIVAQGSSSCFLIIISLFPGGSGLGGFDRVGIKSLRLFTSANNSSVLKPPHTRSGVIGDVICFAEFPPSIPSTPYKNTLSSSSTLT